MTNDAKRHLRHGFPLIGFYLAGVEQIEPLNYAIFNGLWAGLMAAVQVIPMVMSALRKS